MDISDLLYHSPTRAPEPFAPTTVAVHAPAIPTSTPAALPIAEQQQITSPGAREYNQQIYDRYICSICNKAFWYFSQLKRHQRTHTDEKPIHCDHTGCGKTFVQRSHLRVHLRTHKGEKRFHCGSCGKGFSRRYNLRVHIMRTHKGKKPLHGDSAGCKKDSSAQKHAASKEPS